MRHGGVGECGEIAQLIHCNRQQQQTEDGGRFRRPQPSDISLLAFWQRLFSDYPPTAGKKFHLLIPICRSVFHLSLKEKIHAPGLYNVEFQGKGLRNTTPKEIFFWICLL